MINHVRITDGISGITQNLTVILDELSELKKDHAIHIALSGGNTPKDLFLELAANYRKESANNRFHFWWVDERCVAPDHEESNFKWAWELWLGPTGIVKDHIHRIRGEEDCREECIRYSEEIKKWVEIKDGWPCFDLIVLGLGEDGHTASIFPEKIEEFFSTPDICRISHHPQTGQARVTLTGKVLNHARKIIFVVTGKGKSPIVRQVYKERDKRYPASHVRPAEGEVIWLLDKASACDI